MDTKELTAQLEDLQKNLEGKTKEEAKNAIDAFKSEFEKDFAQKVAAKAKEVSAEELKAFKAELLKENGDIAHIMDSKLTELDAKFVQGIKVVQDHADKLDIKLNKGDIREKSSKSFAEVLGEELLEKSDELEKFQRKETKNVVIELKAVGDMTTGNVTGGSRYGQVFDPNIIQRPNRAVHMTDILPGGAIGPGNSFTYMREVGNGEGNPAPVAEGALKSQFDFDLEEATVNIETIAGWLKVTRKAMSNIPGFVSFLQARIPDRFMRILDNQILYGNGTTPNLDGILNTGNFQASTATLADPLIEKIIDDISTLEDTYERIANGILLRPVDYYSFFKNKASGSGEYDLPQGVTIEGGQMRVFGIPVYKSTAINAPDYVVGDWARGAQLLTQEAMRIEFFEQDGDNVRTNKVTIRVEGNYALPIYGNDYFIKGTTAQA